MKYLLWLALILTSIFTGAKLAGVISWSWWLVFTPLIVGVGLYIFILLIVLAIIGICALIALLDD